MDNNIYENCSDMQTPVSEAEFTGELSSATSSINWSNFGRITTLSLSFTRSHSRIARIFGNGSNQVAVTVSLRIQDRHGNKINLTRQDMEAGLVYLCDENTGEMLYTPWSYSFWEGPYHKAISFHNSMVANVEAVSEDISDAAAETGARSSEVDTLTFYVTCSDRRDGGLIAAGINIPGVGRFNTTRNGTSTLNGPGGTSGSIFRNPSNVTVIAERAINYSDKNNIRIEHGGYAVLSQNQHFTSRIMASSYDHYNGVASRKFVSFRSAAGFPFLFHGVSYNPIENQHCSTGVVHHWNVPGMSAVDPTPGAGRPCAVIGRQMPDSSFYAFFWFSRRNHVRFTGSWFSERWQAGRYYMCNFRARVNDNQIGANEHGAATISLYRFRCFEHNNDRLYWNNTFRRPEVFVIDTYGNRGVFYLTFNADNPEDVEIV